MKAHANLALLSSLFVSTVSAVAVPDVDTRYPYTGPEVPVGDWVDPTVRGNGKGFPRLVEAPAVTPASRNPTNNINVIAHSYLPHGIHIHYQTPFGLTDKPTVHWGSSPNSLEYVATGFTHTYDRTPPCSQIAVTQCSQYFHEVQITGLAHGTTHYYMITASNGTTASDVMKFTTARAPGDTTSFSVAVLNDMGYTNAAGTHRELESAINDGVAFAWHGGDISYADDWYSGILPCASDWPVCYNGTSTELPGGFKIPKYYQVPLPKGELPDQGGPQGGDMSVLYESNWDLWQQWMNTISLKIPYMVLPGNHEASCAEFDGPSNIMTAYLNKDKSNSSAPQSALTYYSCPPSQRNFTAYWHRFRMPGDEAGGAGNFWYSFNYGLVHFVSIDTETDFPYSPEYPFVRDLSGGEKYPKKSQTYPTDSGPFGYIHGDVNDNTAYEQYNWLAADLAAVNRTQTPWVLVMGHRPMYSSAVSGYQANIRGAFQSLLLEHSVDAYIAGHIHWYERLYPLTEDGSVDNSSVVNQNTYKTNPGTSLMHLTNGQAGNVESHSILSSGESVQPITAVLDYQHYGFTKLTVHNATALTWTFIKGDDGEAGDEFMLLKSDTKQKRGVNSRSWPTWLW